MASPLPPLRPVHPAWPMVATIALLGATLTSALAGGRVVPAVCFALAVGAAVVALRTIRRFRIEEQAARSRDADPAA